MNRIDVKGFDNFDAFLKDLQDDNPTLIYFSGSKLEGTDQSWCPDCVEAEPIVNAYLNEVKQNFNFVYVDVGDKEYWKDRACPFRTDPRVKLMVIPTIIKWKGVQRLEGSQCNNRELLQLLFEDEE